jgi:hypothetical protein
VNESRRGNRRIGRIVTNAERIARINNEMAATVEREILRSAFVIGERFLVTAWHSIEKEWRDSELLWFRLRQERLNSRSYTYIPIRITNYDVPFDVAALAIDLERLAEVDLNQDAAFDLLGEIAIPLGIDVRVNDEMQVIGFPEDHTGADSDTNSAKVVSTSVPLGNVTALKLFGEAFAAASPINPHGMSGGPVLRTGRASDEGAYQAVGIIRAAPRGSTTSVAAGGGLIATRIEDVADRLPEIGMAISAVRQVRASPELLSLTRDMNVAKAFAACGRTLQDTLVKVNDKHLGPLTGWPHFFNEDKAHRKPTAIGTAYGFKLSMTLGEQYHELDQAALRATLWKLRRPDGGWAARTGTGMRRPEVTALVIGALATGGCRTDELTAAANLFEDGLSHTDDPVAMERTYVVSSMIRGLVRTNPRSARLPELRTALLAGAIKDPAHENLPCWPERMSADRNQDLSPSTPHTAQAIIALARAGHMLGDDPQTRTTINQALRWLLSRRALDNQTEQIRRFVEDNAPWDTLTVRHFTAAWVARALLLPPPAEIPGIDSFLTDAIRRVWGNYRDGYWEWDGRERPLWMAYQGVCVLHDFALRTSAPM